MSGLNKFDGKDKRRQRLQLARHKERNPVARDLGTPKYHPRIIDRKRVEDEDGNLYFMDRYYGDGDEYE